MTERNVLHLFEKARTLDALERAAFIEARSVGDADLGRDLELLLARAERDQHVFDGPALLEDTRRRAIESLQVDLGPDPSLDESLSGAIPRCRRRTPVRAPWTPPASTGTTPAPPTATTFPLRIAGPLAICLVLLIASAL